MAKKKAKTTKKSLKAKVSKKRKSNKKVVRKRKPKDKVVPATKTRKSSPAIIVRSYNWYLHCAKLKIMKDVPIIPCTAIKKDRNGRLFAHTEAEKVYQLYREQCQKHRLVIRRIRGDALETGRPSLRFTKNDVWETQKVSCVRYEGQWEICHVDSGEHEYFEGAGDGDNEIWSINSAQTVAKKCGLLDYFEVAWPQPTDWLQAIKQTVEVLPPAEMKEALIEIIPSVIMESTSIGDEIIKYFGTVLK
jgi:hypothetical protein